MDMCALGRSNSQENINQINNAFFKKNPQAKNSKFGSYHIPWNVIAEFISKCFRVL